MVEMSGSREVTREHQPEIFRWVYNFLQCEGDLMSDMTLIVLVIVLLFLFGGGGGYYYYRGRR